MSNRYPYKAKDRVQGLINALEAMTARDPEQEVQGIALPVLGAAVDAIKADLGDDPVVAAVASVISPEAVTSGEPVRAIDALFVAQQLDAAIGARPPIAC